VADLGARLWASPLRRLSGLQIDTARRFIFLMVTEYGFACAQRYGMAKLVEMGGFAYLYNYSHPLSFNDWGPFPY